MAGAGRTDVGELEGHYGLGVCHAGVSLWIIWELHCIELIDMTTDSLGDGTVW